MKVYLDIITNHTADVIQYRECRPRLPVSLTGEYPYSTRGVRAASRSTPGLRRRCAAPTAATSRRLTRSDFAYTPFVPAEERT